MNNNFNIQRPDLVVDVRQYDIRKKKEHIGRIKIHPGQTLYQLNLATQEIEPVKYDVTAVNLDGSINSEVLTKDDHLYCVAINRKNATRKFILMCKGITKKAISGKL